MASKLSVTESKFLERVRTTLTNVENHPVIKSAMADFGMDEGNLAQGCEFYEQARTSKERNEWEEKETCLSWNAYEEAFDEFRADYAKHREFVRVFYKGNKELLISWACWADCPLSNTMKYLTRESHFIPLPKRILWYKSAFRR